MGKYATSQGRWIIQAQYNTVGYRETNTGRHWDDVDGAETKAEGERILYRYRREEPQWRWRLVSAAVRDRSDLAGSHRTRPSAYHSHPAHPYSHPRSTRHRRA